ncbi:MAG TPA: lysylphosphatidylglycerol synthase transmembrane domain-containing protein [Thermoleophilaceae bacterium]|nr:lysylphosphatidylglycerol synthase transmembrane domain-containing protein [Thermoleophilaceae bacterium]
MSSGASLAAPARAEAPRWRKPLLAVVGLVVSAVCIWLATRNISLSQVGDSLREAEYAWLVPAVVLTYATIVLRGIRWRLLFHDRSLVAASESTAAVNVGLMFNNVLPSRAGEIPRVLGLRRVTGLSAFEIGMTVLVERAIDVFVIAVIGLAIWPALPDRAWVTALGFFCLAVIVACAIFILLLAIFRRRLVTVLERLLLKLPFLSDARAQTVHEALRAGMRIMLRPRALAEAVGVSFLLWGVAGLATWSLFPAFDLSLDSAAPWLVLVANTFALTVPSSSGSIGVYEASVQAALVAYGVSKSAALSYALVLHAVNFFPVILSGVVALSWLGRRAPAERLRARET